MDEERVEGAEGTGETQGAAQETEVQEQPGAGQGAEPEITLDESGGLDIPDRFWDDAPAQGPEKKEEGPEPAWYTPEEFAAAYETGQIDEGKLNPAILDYYKLALGVEQRRRDAAEIQRQAAAQAPQPRPRPQVTWEQVWEAGKMRAAQYLGIKPEEFDEFDERHKAARLMAVNEIRESSQAAARREAQARQAWEGRVAQVARIHSEYRQKVPEIDEIANGFFQAWRQSLTVGQNQAVERILEQGDDAQIRQLYDLVIEGYRAFKNPPKAQGRAAPPPPRVMSAGGAEGEAQGMADAAKLAGMSPEDQASWLMQNKLVV